jgi:glycosyltransferase involved in cell wall biosynthesis
MNIQKSLRVSVVIPVYNEAGRIGACLEAIAAQTTQPCEVIVVDNNSTDGTPEVAARYPFVKLITAKRQGVVHARNRGFNAATGDIIGRIDADTRVASDWVETLQNLFALSDSDAVSGSVSYHDIPCSRFLSRVDLHLRSQAAQRMGDDVFLLGANMAVRRSAWRAVRNQLCLRGGLHEDFDLAIHLREAGSRVVFNEQLRASISARCLNDTFADFWTYARLSPSTYAQHKVPAGRHMYPIFILVILFHLPLRALYRHGNLRDWAQYQRVNPATFVD